MLNRLFRRPPPVQDRTLQRLIFASRWKAEPEALDAELDDIVRVSLKPNAEADVTGLLLAHQGYFLQALEGPAQAVFARYARIRYDPRHAAVRVIHNAPAGARALGAWIMSAKRMSPAGVEMLGELGQRATFEPYKLSEPGAMALLAAVSGKSGTG